MAINGVTFVTNGVYMDTEPTGKQNYCYLDVDMNWNSDADLRYLVVTAGSLVKVNKFVKMMYYPTYSSGAGIGSTMNPIPLTLGKWHYILKPNSYFVTSMIPVSFIIMESSGKKSVDFYGLTSKDTDIYETFAKITEQSTDGSTGTINIRIPLVTNDVFEPIFNGIIAQAFMQPTSERALVLQQPFLCFNKVTSRTQYALNYQKGWKLYYRIAELRNTLEEPFPVASSGNFEEGYFFDTVGREFDELSWAQRLIKVQSNENYFWINIPNQYTTYRYLTFGAGIDNSQFGFDPDYPVSLNGGMQARWLFSSEIDTGGAGNEGSTRYMVLYRMASTVSGPPGSDISKNTIACDQAPLVCSENWDMTIDATYQNECVYYINDDGTLDRFIWGSGYRQIPIKTLINNRIIDNMQLLPSYATSWRF